MAATSSNAVQPIAFDNTDQVDAQLQRLEQRIELHVQQVSKGKDKAFADQIRAILRETVTAPLAGIVHQNISVNGMSWEDHLEQTNHAVQPVNTALLKSTIETQDAAFQLSSGNAIKRSIKVVQLATQVDNRISRVTRSGRDKTELLDLQQAKRAASLTINGEAVPFANDVGKDLQSAEKDLADANAKATYLRAKSERAISLAADVTLMQSR